MFKEFLEAFSNIVGRIPDPSVTDPEDEHVKKMIMLYPRLSDSEKRSFREMITSFDDLGFENRLYFDFFGLHNFKDQCFAEDILDVLTTEDMEPSKRYNYQIVLGRELFLSGVRADYRKRLAVEEKIVQQIRESAQLFPEYIPYRDRNKKTVVIMISPFLGAYHSPSMVAISLGYYLEQLKYKVYFVSVNDNEILEHFGSDVYLAFIRNKLYNGITEFEYDCFGYVIKGLHFDLRTGSMADDLSALAVHISRMAPEFIVGVESSNILADICSLYTDVISMNIVDDLPVTLSNITLRYFAGDMKNEYVNADIYGKKVFHAVFQNAFQPFNRGEEIKGLPEDRFLICIMGNRLDDELGDEMLEVMREVLHGIPETDFVFIGNCPKTEIRLDEVKDRCHFLGYVERCEDTIAKCSLFLNPPRKGGGGGGFMAIKRGVPVYTLKNCDVASCIGDAFSYDSYEHLIPFIMKCLKDTDYYGQMRKKALETYERTFGDKSQENIKDFCDKITEYLEKETRMNDE
ncbi:MAG: glycosyltransferase [Lachnospiraceae bacterium]|nr:glycosyltransferase [Lachnospiraceae bacterium]